MKNKIAGAIASPHELEALYRTKPAEFAAALREVLSEHPESPVLQAWRERLFFGEAAAPHAGRPAAERLRRGDIALTVLLSFAAGTLAKIPQFFGAAKEERFYPRNISAIVFGALAAYFCLRKPNRRKIAAVLAFCHLAGLLWHYIRFAVRKAGFEPLERWITGYIPAYTVWSIVVAAVFPPAFGFK